MQKRNTKLLYQPPLLLLCKDKSRILESPRGEEEKILSRAGGV
jgi:hypothetical protein